MPTPARRPSGSNDNKTTSKKNLVVILKLPSNLLAPFAPEPSLKESASIPKSIRSSSISTPFAVDDSPVDIASESNGTPAAEGTPIPTDTPVGSSTPVPADGSAKRKGIPGPKPGSKRAPGMIGDGLPRARGKPGPKKKLRLDDGTVDRGENGTASRGLTNSGLMGNHKLGPKANQGAINAGLRALDRSGNPCKKWEKKGFQIKSFTGVTWGIHSWRTPRPKIDVLINGSSDQPLNGSQDPAADSSGKENKGGSAIDSEKSNNGGDVTGPLDTSQLASSPVPMANFI